jgi:spore coat protein SA
MIEPRPDPPSRTFHLLSEAEPFSEHDGGAISRWAANVLRSDTQGIVLAPAADDTWSFPAERVRTMTRLPAYKQLNDRAGRFLRWPLRRSVLRVALRPALDDLRPGDTVWVHNRPEFAAAIGTLVHARGARLVLHLHNAHLLHWPERMVYAIRADCYVFVSRFLMQQAEERFSRLGHCEVLHNGADRSIFYPRIDSCRPAGPPMVLFAGRLVPDKGLHIFLSAMRVLQKRGVAVVGIVFGGAGFGTSPPTDYIREMQQSAPGNVSFQSYCSGAALGARFRGADIACVPSCWQDPMPLVVLEAMACGLPVVASRSGGIPEMLAEGGGILVDRGSVEQLADALQLLATDADLRKRLGVQAHAVAQRSFMWETVRQNYQRIVQTVLSADKCVEALWRSTPRT